MKKKRLRLKIHLETLGFMLGTVLPLMIRRRTRPVVFLRYGGLGDVLSTFPAALKLKERHPGAGFIYHCHPDYVCLPRLAGITSNTYSKAFHGDTVTKYWSFLVSKVYVFVYGDEREHSVSTESIIVQFHRLHGLPVDDLHSLLSIDARVLARIKALVEKHFDLTKPVVIIHPGPSWAVKQWPAEAWSLLVGALRDHGFKQIIQLGVRQQIQPGALPCPVMPGVLSLVDQLTVEETAALVSLGRLLIGIDSGILHLAASLKTPAIGIFGPTSPQFYYSPRNNARFAVSRAECQGCHHVLPRAHWVTGCPHEIKCMKMISVDEVLQLALSKLTSEAR